MIERMKDIILITPSQ